MRKIISLILLIMVCGTSYSQTVINAATSAISYTINSTTTPTYYPLSALVSTGGQLHPVKVYGNAGSKSYTFVIPAASHVAAVTTMLMDFSDCDLVTVQILKFTGNGMTASYIQSGTFIANVKGSPYHENVTPNWLDVLPSTLSGYASGTIGALGLQKPLELGGNWMVNVEMAAGYTAGSTTILTLSGRKTGAR